jgi:hypothetical protein
VVEASAWACRNGILIDNLKKINTQEKQQQQQQLFFLLRVT